MMPERSQPLSSRTYRGWCDIVNRTFESVDPRDILRLFGAEATRSFAFHVSRNTVKEIKVSSNKATLACPLIHPSVVASLSLRSTNTVCILPCLTQSRASGSGSSTEVASKVLADYFSRQGTVGHTSLEVLNCLVAAGDDTIEPMVQMALPSTLIKTIYLFYDLPVPTSAEFKVDWERMQGRFVRLVSKLCENILAAKEIITTDDM